MRKTFLLALPLLAGCASAAAKPSSRPGPVIRPVATAYYVADDSAGMTKIPSTRAVQIPLTDGPCRTGDRMPTGRLDFGALPPMPSARPSGALPYIPNVCPVLVQPGIEANSPVIYLRGPKRVETMEP